ncbi:MAG: hypothetical protein QM760_17405 [Nibricoccus sp.]
MRQRILCFVNDRRHHLKREWAARLRRAPVRNAMAEPVILVHMMDETLDQLADLLVRKTRPRGEIAGDFENRCVCRLNPLLAYFTTGEASLMFLLGREESVDEPLYALVRSSWRLLAQREIDAVCGMCVRSCRSPYPKAELGLTTQPLTSGAVYPGK